MNKRNYHKVLCAGCGIKCWTSSCKPDYLCMACRRERGMTLSGSAGYGEGYTTLSTIKIVMGFGKCKGCHRDDKPLVNGRCDDCRFYGLGDVDADLSERGRRARGGQFDWRRGQWSNKGE